MTVADSLSRRLEMLAERLPPLTALSSIGRLSGGHALAVAFSLASLPLLSRLTVPENYAPLAVFVATTTTIGAFSTLAFTNGIVGEHSARRAHELSIVSITCGLGFSLLVAAAVLGIYFARELSAFGPMGWWVFAVPATVLANSFAEAVSALGNRCQAYERLSVIPVAVSLVTVATTLFLCTLNFGSHGVMAGFLAGQATAFALYWRLYSSLGLDRRTIAPRSMMQVAYRHRRFAYFSMPASVLWASLMALPVYALSYVGATNALGEFNRARFIASAPISIVSGAVTWVYRQRAADALRHDLDCRREFVRIFLLLSLVGAPAAAVLGVFGATIFELVLGDDWGGAGVFAQILAPMLFLRFVAAPLSHTLFLASAQRIDLLLMGGAFILTAALLTLASVQDWSADQMVICFVLGCSVLYISQIVSSWLVASEFGSAKPEPHDRIERN